MNKVQKFTLTAIFSLTAALAFSCSPNDDDPILDMDEASSSSEANASTPSSSSDLSTPSGSSSSGYGSSPSSSSSACVATAKIEGATLIDARDNKEYKTVVICDQTWMAENLNYDATGSKCYGESGKTRDETASIVTLSDTEIQANCAKYGRLYNWATAMDIDEKYNTEPFNDLESVYPKYQGICPTGWHLPGGGDWNKLMANVGYNNVGKILKATSGWNDRADGTSGNGTDDLGFAALPGGFGNYYDCDFCDVGYYGYWWSTSHEILFDEKYLKINYWSVSYGGDSATLFGTGVGPVERIYLLSIRCIKD